MIKIIDLVREHVIKPKKPLESIIGEVTSESDFSYTIHRGKSARATVIEFVNSIKKSNPVRVSVYKTSPGVYYIFVNRSDTDHFLVVDTTCPEYDNILLFFKLKSEKRHVPYNIVKLLFDDLTSLEGAPRVHDIDQINDIP